MILFSLGISPRSSVDVVWAGFQVPILHPHTTINALKPRSRSLTAMHTHIPIYSPIYYTFILIQREARLNRAGCHVTLWCTQCVVYSFVCHAVCVSFLRIFIAALPAPCQPVLSEISFLVNSFSVAQFELWVCGVYVLFFFILGSFSRFFFINLTVYIIVAAILLHLMAVTYVATHNQSTFR